MPATKPVTTASRLAVAAEDLRKAQQSLQAIDVRTLPRTGYLREGIKAARQNTDQALREVLVSLRSAP